jgi:membrane-associated protease RseP (regulator of RpoE activity)
VDTGVWHAPAKFQDRGWVHVLLFMLTLATTTLVGAIQYAGFVDNFAGNPQLPMPMAALYLRGFWYSGTVLLILGCHEMGHYLACRYYDVDASLPFFIPLFIPLPVFQTGTLGACIRIREQIPRKHMLFDIGIAGPIAGFLVAVPALFLGIAMSRVAKLPIDQSGLINLGEPLLFKAASWLFWGTQPDGYSLNMHPMAAAAWFGLLATTYNLFPVGQLDGGHISYAVLGRRSTYVSFATVGILLALTLGFSASWGVWTVLTFAMLLVFGPRHPRVFDDEVPLDRARLVLALFAVVIFVLCFTPVPIDMVK